MFQQSFLHSLRTQDPQVDVPAKQPQIISNVFIDFSLRPLYYGNMFWQVKKSWGETRTQPPGVLIAVRLQTGINQGEK